VPAGATTGNVVVTVGGMASNGVNFTVTIPSPSITSLNPTSGVIGTPVTIMGANSARRQGTSTVTFNGIAATPTSWSATSITAAVPAGATARAFVARQRAGTLCGDAGRLRARSQGQPRSPVTTSGRVTRRANRIPPSLRCGMPSANSCIASSARCWRTCCRASQGNIAKAARLAQKNRRAFFELMRKHGWSTPDVSASRGGPRPGGATEIDSQTTHR